MHLYSALVIGLPTSCRPPTDISPPLLVGSTEKGYMLLYYDFLTKKVISIDTTVACFEMLFIPLNLSLSIYKPTQKNPYKVVKAQDL